MKKATEQRRTALIKLRVSEEELTKIQSNLRQSTERSLSAYLRKLALNKPITVKVRNASADDFLRDMFHLKGALEETNRLYGQAVTRLQLLEKIPDFKDWLFRHEATRKTIFLQVSAIENRITQLYEQWLQK